MRNYIFFRAWPNRPAQNPLNGKDPPSRRVFGSKKLYLMKKIITFKLSVQNYCQIHIPASCFALKKVKPSLLVFTPLFFVRLYSVNHLRVVCAMPKSTRTMCASPFEDQVYQDRHRARETQDRCYFLRTVRTLRAHQEETTDTSFCW